MRLVGAFAIALLGACMGGTETDITVTTDAQCSAISNAIISLSGMVTTAVCANGSFGTAVYHPTDTQTDVEVVATVDGSDPNVCFTSPGTGCIVARKKAPVSYQTNVTIELTQDCAGISCPQNQTCSHAVCVAE